MYMYMYNTYCIYIVYVYVYHTWKKVGILVAGYRRSGPKTTRNVQKRRKKVKNDAKIQGKCRPKNKLFDP